MDGDGQPGFERVLAALSRHLEDRHGFCGLRLETASTAGARVAYRVLPAPFAGPDQRLRLLPLDPAGRPQAHGARRLTIDEVFGVLGEALSQAARGWAASVTRTAGLETRFGPGGVELSFRSAAAVAPLIPVPDQGAGRRL